MTDIQGGGGGKVPVKLRITIEFDSDDEARTIGEALKVDDDGFVETIIDGNEVTAHVTARSVSSARRAADDWLACLMSIKGGRDH